MHEHYLYRNMYRGSAVECRGWLMGWGGIAYRASSFNDSLLTFLLVSDRGISTSERLKACRIRWCIASISLTCMPPNHQAEVPSGCFYHDNAWLS